jgi:hypothetical protein
MAWLAIVASTVVTTAAAQSSDTPATTSMATPVASVAANPETDPGNAIGPKLSEVAFQQPIEDPAIGTVDQQTGQMSNDDSGSLMESVRDRWSRIQDPSITTVDQQTRGSGSDKKNWFDRLSLRGYSQFRFNEMLGQEPGSAARHLVGDGSVQDNNSFSIRRARLILSGDVSEYMYVYIQPDFAVNVPGVEDANHYTQLRDCYGDIYFDKEKIHRLRIGQSKIPYGWENLQSSSNRVPLDRNDGLNSGARNERDLGVFYYYTPDFAQDLFKYVLDEGLKGSGNYGLFGIGAYNGQGGSLREQNDNLHVISRFTLPYRLPNNQIIEMSVQGYTGQYVVITSPLRQPEGTLVRPTNNPDGFRDERIAGTFILYPQPIGFQAEWNVGRGPALDEATNVIEERALRGGYAMLLARHEFKKMGVMLPFVRWNYYEGGYKSERNAPYSFIDETEIGLEWQFNPQMELTTQFTITDRTNTIPVTTTDPYGQFVGSLVRVQFQINY